MRLLADRGHAVTRVRHPSMFLSCAAVFFVSKQGWESIRPIKMSLGSPRPLAQWKTWWGPELASQIATALHEHVDPKLLPGEGQLMDKSKFDADALNEDHVQNVAEALLATYPYERLGSAYLLGDACLQLNHLWNGGLLGLAEGNPIKDKSIRDCALKEGEKMKRLLSYIRTSGYKNDLGRSDRVTYLKTLANQRRGHRSSSSSSFASSSPREPVQSVPSSPNQFLSRLVGGHHGSWVIACFCVEQIGSLIGRAVVEQQKGFLKVWFVSEPFLVRTSGKSGRQWISMSSTAPWSF